MVSMAVRRSVLWCGACGVAHPVCRCLRHRVGWRRRSVALPAIPNAKVAAKRGTPRISVAFARWWVACVRNVFEYFACSLWRVRYLIGTGTRFPTRGNYLGVRTTRRQYYRNYPTCQELPVPPPRRHCYGGRGRTASLLALVGELAGARGCEGVGGRDRVFIKRLLARRDRHRLEHVIFSNSESSAYL